ncbi:hypothetical protein [Actinophytocola algeriensis]|uniref:Uncharacterized protein n=1 Tax=Actinophytocola algeriensis TaxID=1768010 RepID=A0A7W7VFF5_9PSEU|nr:hypothetical protein [Actinophytocola algeriensis]MBB4908251.1 hypothetical protein [Actinophytocola algeriensis]MBE1480281.1 hypothetical protein [Actinophytocola algeriensis]
MARRRPTATTVPFGPTWSASHPSRVQRAAARPGADHGATRTTRTPSREERDARLRHEVEQIGARQEAGERDDRIDPAVLQLIINWRRCSRKGDT